MSEQPSGLTAHSRSPRNMGAMADPDVVGIGSSNGRPPQTEIYLQVREGKIAKASFTTFGCGVSIACGSVLTDLIQGKSLVECWSVTEEAVIDALGGIPAHRRFCADLVIRALKDAIMRLVDEVPAEKSGCEPTGRGDE